MGAGSAYAEYNAALLAPDDIEMLHGAFTRELAAWADNEPAQAGAGAEAEAEAEAGLTP